MAVKSDEFMSGKRRQLVAWEDMADGRRYPLRNVDEKCNLLVLQLLNIMERELLLS